jgi:hypothetical protein
MDRRVWLSRRALKLHAVIIVVVPAFLALCVWQLVRALGGNELSWAYVFEWPFFAGYAVYMWWRFVHEIPEVPAAASEAAASNGAASNGAPSGRTAARPGPAGNAANDDGGVEGADTELAAYNAYLAQLAARDKAAGR